jgi:CheY-like chemotaxis protein
MAQERTTILIIEDSPVQATSIGNLLENEGVNVLYAPDGLAGIYMAKQHVPDAVVLDYEMPGINGFEVCRRLKDDERTARIPVVMLTAHADRAGMGVQGLDLGAIDFIPKDSFADTVLLETLRQLHVLQGASAEE